MKRCLAYLCLVLCAVVARPSSAGLTYEADPVVLEMPLRGTTEILLTSDYQLSQLRILSGLMDGSCKRDGVPYTGSICFMTRDETSCTFELQYRNQTDSGSWDWIKGVRVRLEQKSAGLYAQAVAAFYYDQKLGVGTHSYDEVGQGVVKPGTLYDGKNTGYGVQSLTVAVLTTDVYAGELPEGAVTVGWGVGLTLKDAALASTVANDFTLNGATLRIEADQPTQFTGAFSGMESDIVIKTGTGSPAAPVEPRSSEETSLAAVFTTTEQKMFAGVQLKDLTPVSAAMCGNTEGLVANPYYVTRTGDRMTIEFQQDGGNNDWIKGVKVELVQRGADVYGRAVQAFYYSYRGHQVGQYSVDADADAIKASGGKVDQELNTTGTGMSGYGIRTMTALVTRSLILRSTPEGFVLRGFGYSTESHIPMRAFTGASVEDIVSLGATLLAQGQVSSSALLTVLPPKAVADGREYQLQFLDGDYVKCLYLRFVNAADNSILAYLTRCCAYEADKVTVGTDLSTVTPYRERCDYGLSEISILLEKETATPTVLLDGENAVTGGMKITVEDGSRLKFTNPNALPATGALEVGEGAQLLLDSSAGIDWSITKSYSVRAARNSEVVLFGRTPGIGTVTLDGGRLTLLSRHESNNDFGTYLETIELRNGAKMTGYSPRINNRTKLLVTGEGCATVENGIFLCMGNSDGGFYTLDVADTVAGDEVDLELSGDVGVYGKNNQGGSVRKTGAGTLRMDSAYAQDFWAGNRLEEGTWILAKSEAWGEQNPLTLVGGKLVLEDGVTGVAIPSLDLQGDAALEMGANATFDLGDSTAKAWKDGAVLSVTMPKSARLTAADLTADQLRQIRINGYHALRTTSGLLVPSTGLIVVFR